MNRDFPHRGLTDSPGLLFDLIGHDRLTIVVELNAESKISKLDRSFAAQEDVSTYVATNRPLKEHQR